MKFQELANRVIHTRGSMGIRAAAKEIGISPTTLSRIERGHVPDMGTLEKVCSWLGEDAEKFSAIGGVQIAFKKKAAVSEDTAKSLANVIDALSRQYANHIDAIGH